MVNIPADGDQPPKEPLLRVVRGNATPEEVAAMVGVVVTRSGDDEHAAPPAPRSAWSDRRAQLRPPLHPGPGAWRRSALPL